MIIQLSDPRRMHFSKHFDEQVRPLSGFVEIRI